MKEQEFKKLSLAFDVVFDIEGQIKACGRAACMDLITLMKGYSSKSVGDEKTGKINIEIMKNKYLKILRTYICG